MRRLLDRLVAKGFRQARKGSRGWLAVAAGAWVLRRATRTGRDPRPVWTAELGPGESVVVSHLAGPPGEA